MLTRGLFFLDPSAIMAGDDPFTEDICHEASEEQGTREGNSIR